MCMVQHLHQNQFLLQLIKIGVLEEIIDKQTLNNNNSPCMWEFNVTVCKLLLKISVQDRVISPDMKMKEVQSLEEKSKLKTSCDIRKKITETKCDTSVCDINLEDLIVKLLQSEFYEVRQTVLSQLCEISQSKVARTEIMIEERYENCLEEKNGFNGESKNTTGEATKGGNSLIKNSEKIYLTLVSMVETEVNEECLQDLFRYALRLFL